MLTFIKIFVIIGVVVTGLKQWQRHKAEAALPAESSEVARPQEFSVVRRPTPVAQGFTEATTPINMPRGKVLIVAPACGNEADRQANELGRRLLKAGIPFARTAEVKFPASMGRDKVSQIQSVMNQPLPLVFVRNRAQSKPSPEQVLAEVRRVR